MSEIFREKLRNASKLSGERRKKEIGESKTQKQDENDMFKVGIIFVLFLFANSNSFKSFIHIYSWVCPSIRFLDPLPLLSILYMTLFFVI